MNQSKKQANFLISIQVLKILKSHVPVRKQSEFVEHAITKALQNEQFRSAVEKAFGTWKTKDHPLSTEKFIRSLRKDRKFSS